MGYPVSVQIDYVERRSRLSTFFRFLLAIPHWIWAAIYGIGVFVAVVIAWFALLFTGRWPESLYQFTVGFLRYYGRLFGYLNLAVDPYPPFDGGEHPEYPLRVTVAPPAEHYSRLKVFLRGLYVIPAYIVTYVLSLVLYVVSILAWLVIVILGRQPAALQDVIRFCVVYTLRVWALFTLLTETYPPFGDEPPSAMAPTA